MILFPISHITTKQPQIWSVHLPKTYISPTTLTSFFPHYHHHHSPSIMPQTFLNITFPDHYDNDTPPSLPVTKGILSSVLSCHIRCYIYFTIQVQTFFHYMDISQRYI